MAPTPNPPTVTSHTLDGVKAVVTGTGQPGATLKLFSDGIFVGSTTVLPDGTYSVTSSDLVPGLHSLTVSQEVNGAVSNSVDAGTVNVVPPPPTWSSTTLQQPGSSVIITGSGVPGDVIDIYEGNTKVATTTVAVDGTWSAIISTPLPVGIHSFTAKQSVDGISSSAVPAGSVTITAAASTTRAAAGTTAAPPVPTTGALAGTTTAEAAAPSTTSAGPTPTTLTLTSSSETETQSSTTSVTEVFIIYRDLVSVYEVGKGADLLLRALPPSCALLVLDHLCPPPRWIKRPRLALLLQRLQVPPQRLSRVPLKPRPAAPRRKPAHLW